MSEKASLRSIGGGGLLYYYSTRNLTYTFPFSLQSVWGRRNKEKWTSHSPSKVFVTPAPVSLYSFRVTFRERLVGLKKLRARSWRSAVEKLGLVRLDVSLRSIISDATRQQRERERKNGFKPMDSSASTLYLDFQHNRRNTIYDSVHNIATFLKTSCDYYTTYKLITFSSGVQTATNN